MSFEAQDWFASLRTDGLFLSASRQSEHFDLNLQVFPEWLLHRLRRHLIPVLASDTTQVNALLETLFEDFAHLNFEDGGYWYRANSVPNQWSVKLSSFHNTTLRPDWLWQGKNNSFLPVFIARKGRFGLNFDDWIHRALGRGRSNIAVSQVLEWMRRTKSPLAILTTGRYIRLIYAGLDSDAYVEFDVDRFFEGGEAGPQLTAFTRLLNRDVLEKPAPDQPSPLHHAIQKSREGQAELSTILGERLRRAVELLIRSTNTEKLRVLDEGGQVDRRHIYLAASRIIMRCVVILFAEARDLLPRDNEVYSRSYSLESLRDELERAAAGSADRLRHRHSAWPRILANFRLLYFGSAHPALPITAYGGDLFSPGDPNSSDPIQQVLAIFEDPQNAFPDSVVHQILRLITRSKVRIRSGRGRTTIEAPVDFSELSTEYIGIIYEGLLDYELHRATEPMIFLDVGDQPILPFDRLDTMEDKQLKDLFAELARGSKLKLSDDEEDSEEEELEEQAAEEEQEEQEEQEELLSSEDDEDDEDDDLDDELSDELELEIREKIFEWAKRAVVAADIVRPPRNATEPEDWTWEFTQKVEKAARRLVPASRIFMPGRWYLVRWGGTRKGSGTFYTRPQLAIPTVERTLEPLIYNETQYRDAEGQLQTYQEIKTPEEILSLKICDPSMGSGSFLIATLRYLTDQLFISLHHHKKIKQKGQRSFIRLADGHPLEDSQEEPLPPQDDPRFEERLRARIKRYIVERSIYGVDLDPLATELARLALWIETMDRDLPFGFIDHKIKCGNSLVGTWLDQFPDYPALAFERSGWDGGDKGHQGYHFKKDQIGKALKKTRDERIKPELRQSIESRVQAALLEELQIPVDDLHQSLTAAFEALHNLPVHETKEREELYRKHFQENPHFQQLRTLFDTWAAIWFWPAHELDHVPTPQTWRNPSPETQKILASLVNQYRFFHWELEFPDVFNQSRPGFDAILGNPPWEISKPNSKEFFSNLDPLYRTYGKQEALKVQRELFKKNSTGRIERDWLEYNAHFKGLSNFFNNRAHPFGDGKESLGGKGASLNLMQYGGQWRTSDQLHRLWQDQRQDRTGYADPEHPFQHQGSADINTYKLFLEMAHALLKPQGHLGFIVPSGIYTDRGTTQLRELFLNRCRWRWLFGFENRNGIFDIHRSFKFAVLILQKGDSTDSIRAAFMHRDLADWENADAFALDYPASRILQFSPRSKSILELRSEKDLEILEKIYDNGVLLGDESEEGWGIKYAREFDMTNDSHLFPPRPQWEEKGYRPDEYGHWLKGPWKPIEDFGFDPHKHRLDPQHRHWSILDRPKGVVLSRDGQLALNVKDLEDVALPLYQGVMIHQFDPSQKGWVSGTGLRAVWEDIGWEEKGLSPQLLISKQDVVTNAKVRHGAKIAFRDIARTTDERTMIAALLPNMPAGNVLGILSSESKPIWPLITVLNSFVFDWSARQRVGGTHLNYYVIEELPLITKTATTAPLPRLARQLNMVMPNYANYWLNDHSVSLHTKSWRQYWAIRDYERLRLRIIADSLISLSFDFAPRDLTQVLHDSVLPLALLSKNEFTGELDPKGFWRVDRDKHPELRHTVLAQVAFQDLHRLIDHYGGDKERAIAVFSGMATADQVGDPTALKQKLPHIDPLEGWLLPETLRLADYGLGHDDRAKHPQPVASRLGPRFYDWQLTQPAPESWEECRRHAELLELIVPTTPTPTQEEEQKQPTSSAQPSLL